MPASCHGPVLKRTAPFLTLSAHGQVCHGHIKTLQERGIQIIDSEVKTLACGDTGKGAMANVASIVGAVIEALEAHEKLVTAAEDDGRPPYVP